MEIYNIAMILLFAYLGIGVLVWCLAIAGVAKNIKHTIKREKLGAILTVVFVIIALIYTILVFIIGWPTALIKAKRMVDGD